MSTNANKLSISELLCEGWISRILREEWPGSEALTVARRRAVCQADMIAKRALELGHILANVEIGPIEEMRCMEELNNLLPSDAQTRRLRWMAMVSIVDHTVRHLRYKRQEPRADDPNSHFLASWCNQWGARVSAEQACDAMRGWMRPTAKWSAMLKLARTAGLKPPSKDTMRKQHSAALVKQRARDAENWAKLSSLKSSSKI
jgi:hypothetical protein